MRTILLSVAMLVLSCACMAQNNALTFGITLCGAEFGPENLPGTLGVHYTYPQPDEIDYFASKGVHVIQLPFKWERIQRTLGGPLDTKELALITRFVDQCATRNIQVTLVLQNFGRYRINGVDHILGDPLLPASYFKDFWKKMAIAMMDKNNIFAFSIMSEPNHMGGYNWGASAQQAIYGIREVDRETNIIVDGDNYSNPETWVKYNDNLRFLFDPANKMYFNAHCYFDEDYTGAYKKPYVLSGATEMTGVNRIKPFLDWCSNYGKKPYVGEFGVPKNDNRWLKVMDNFLKYLTDRKVSGSYWAAGAWWKNYPLSIEPVNNADQPQMQLYTQYLQKTNPNYCHGSGLSTIYS